METTVPQAALEPQAGSSPGGEDVVMVPVDEGVPPPLSTGERDLTASAAPEPSAAETAVPAEDVENMSMSRYLTIPGIGTIDLDAAELPSNYREILEAVTERVFADPSPLDVVMLGLPEPRQDREVNGSASFVAPEAAEGVLGESAIGTESAAIAPSLSAAGATVDVPLLQAVKASAAPPPPSWQGRSRKSSGRQNHHPPSPLSPWRRSFLC
jgi:hypothetical protein